MADYQYRLSETQKREIAQNLIKFLEDDTYLANESKIFVSKWIQTRPEEKQKAFFDVWDIVLKNYLHTSRPVLFRSCSRRSKEGRIASFTGRLECIRRLSNSKGIVIMCDTKDSLAYNFKKGNYRRTFYPIVDLLKKAKSLGGCEFSDRILNDFIGEDEYIMRVDLDNMHSFKWL